MNKRWLLVIAILIFVSTIAVRTVFAAGPIKLIINGQEVKPSAPLQIVDNRVMAPVRQIAETLGASVVWNGQDQTVEISNEGQQDSDRRLGLIEFALVSGGPEAVANTWAKGVASRNGALQYAVLSENLRSENTSGYRSWNWVTGSSSPWVDSYQVSAGEQQDDGTWKFTIEFHYTDSTTATSSHTSTILVGTEMVDKAPLPVVYPGTGQKWYVMKVD